ncbi:LEM3/CDC50 family protein [Arthroderma uncinatum]|uniref:LEM3/CDC50 family protein n=1 Tax=Arthroderma uncinatum TaxID=74035 RepID=UPI00144A68D7|nr:LEM3/CDC50 family protein [Arthroderma uncinatum]KAF3483582.1 LEM3/CDC50 family protein [Arthroderma uncinatum]
MAVEELVFDYSNCNEAKIGQENATDASSRVRASFKTKSNGGGVPYQWYRSELEGTDITLDNGVHVNTTVCSLIFDIPNDIGAPVYMYYRLTNFYQNHRRYVKSLDLDQMKGVAVPNGTISTSTCDPLRIDENTKKAYYPCGLIANSLFNDTFSEPKRVGGGSNVNETYPMTNRGISWSSDRDLYKPTKYNFDQVSPPPNWKKRYPDGYTEKNPPPNLQTWEELQVWMRTAGLPTFSKLALRNDTGRMLAGSYQVDINDNFNVTIFGGTKSMVITTRSVMGGKNPFLGIAYVVIGGLCILLGTIFTFVHLVKPRKLGDHRYLTWNSEENTTGAATGTAATPKSFFNFRRRG